MPLDIRLPRRPGVFREHLHIRLLAHGLQPLLNRLIIRTRNRNQRL